MLFAFKLPDLFAKFCVVRACFVVERQLIVSKPCYKFCGHKPYVCFGFTLRRHFGLINDSLRKAVSF